MSANPPDNTYGPSKAAVEHAQKRLFDVFQRPDHAARGARVAADALYDSALRVEDRSVNAGWVLDWIRGEYAGGDERKAQTHYALKLADALEEALRNAR